jgi:uncharacterized membrane protein YhhN
VTTPAALALALAALFAIGDWVARARRDRVFEYVCKPATMVALIWFALALEPAAGQGARRILFVVALAFSLLGDVLLMLPSDRFVAGLAAFLVAHGFYIAGLLVHAPAGAAVVLAALAVLLVLVPLAARILSAIARSGARELLGPVAAYVAVIATMLVLALASGNPWAGAGAALFVTSDAMIAWNRFVGSFRGADVAIMVTYHLGQAALAGSLLLAA